MKKLIIMVLGVFIALPALARDFTYEYEGQTLIYTVISEEEKTVMTKEGWFNTPGIYIVRQGNTVKKISVK